MSKLVVSKEAMARIGRQMLKRKGVTEDEVNKLRVYQHAVEGRVHNDFHLPLAERRNLYERSNWKSLAVEKGDKQNGCYYRVYTMRKFLGEHFPQSGLDDWDPTDEIGVPEFGGAHWPRFYEAWVKRDQAAQKELAQQSSSKKQKLDSSGPTLALPGLSEDTYSEPGSSEPGDSEPGAIDLATRLLEKLRGELACAAPDSATRTALQEAIEKVGPLIDGLAQAAFVDTGLSTEDLEALGKLPPIEVQAMPVDAPAYRVGGDDAGEGTAGFCALGGDDGEGEGQARFCALDGDDAQASAPQRAPAAALVAAHARAASRCGCANYTFSRARQPKPTNPNFPEHSCSTLEKRVASAQLLASSAWTQHQRSQSTRSHVLQACHHSSRPSAT